MILRKRFILSSCVLAFTLAIARPAFPADTYFRVTLPAGTGQPVTGRVFVVISKAESPEPRLQVGSPRSRVEFLGKDAQGLAPGENIVLDSLTLGFPFKSIRELPAGDYYVQAFLNVYTRFLRAD